MVKVRLRGVGERKRERTEERRRNEELCSRSSGLVVTGLGAGDALDRVELLERLADDVDHTLDVLLVNDQRRRQSDAGTGNSCQLIV